MDVSFSYSRRDTLESCARKYYFKYVLGLHQKTTRQSQRMGSAFAHALEHNDARRVWDKYENALLSPETANMNEVKLEATVAEVMAEAYLAKYRDHDLQYQQEPEYAFTHGIEGTDKKVVGMLDNLLTDADGKRIGVECKLLNPRFWNQASVDALAMDGQVTSYFYAMMLEDKPLTKMLYRTTFKPSIQIWKGGKRTKNNPTGAPETISQYADRLRASISSDPEKYLQEYVCYRTISDLEEFGEALKSVSDHHDRLMAEGKWAKPTGKPPCSDYGGCEYLPLCRGEANAKNLYTKKDNV